MKKLTQEEAVLTWLQEYGTINPLQALREIGCFRLAAIIHKLKKKGYQISVTRINKQGKFRKVNFAEYRLISISE